MTIDPAGPTEAPLDPTGPTHAAEPTSLAATLMASAQETGEPTVPEGSARYAVGPEIGRGGMGAVFSANDRQFSRQVAVKKLRSAKPTTELRRRFNTEALVAGNLEHPGIPPVYERGTDGGGAFYVMRRVRGETLEQALRNTKSLEQRLELVPTLIRVAETLAYSHAQGVIHRDIKPSNIVLGHYGESYVLDWGIAKVRGAPTTMEPSEPSPTDESNSPTSTAQGSVIGTPAYMSPEQASGRQDAIDERTDVFALGAMLYHLLTGHQPYRSRDAVDKAKRCEFEPLDTTAPTAPQALRAICSKAMARRPEDRYGTASELATALTRFTTDAVKRQDKGPVGWIATAVTAITAVVAIVALIRVISISATIDAGIPVIIADALCFFGVGLSILHYRTKGAYCLSPLILALAGATFLVGFIGAAEGEQLVLQAALGVMDDPERYRLVVTEGSRQALSNISASAALTLLQAIAWAWAERHAKMARP